MTEFLGIFEKQGSSNWSACSRVLHMLRWCVHLRVEGIHYSGYRDRCRPELQVLEENPQFGQRLPRCPYSTAETRDNNTQDPGRFRLADNAIGKLTGLPSNDRLG